MDQELAESPRQFVDALKTTIFRRRVGQIALAVVLAEACIRYLSALIWYLIIPIIANILQGHTESVLLQNRREFPWVQLFGATLEVTGALVFVFYVNRWLYGPNRPRKIGEEEESLPEQSNRREEDDEPLVPRMLSAPYPTHTAVEATTPNDDQATNH